MFDAAAWGCAIRRGDHGFHLVSGQPGDLLPHRLFRRNGTDVAGPFDEGSVTASDISGEGANGGQALVAGLDRTSPVPLKVVEERQHAPGAEIRDGQPFHRPAKFCADEGQ